MRIFLYSTGLSSAALCGTIVVAAPGQPTTPPAAVAFKPLYPNARPICTPEALREVKIPNTTIDDVTVDPRDGSCRVTATVTHPPAKDRVKVFIGRPMQGWNGRFRGNGGDGFTGGSADSLRTPVAQGFAAGATDTGHEGGSGQLRAQPARPAQLAGHPRQRVSGNS